MTPQLRELQFELVEIAAELRELGLATTTGGNLSLRAEDKVCMTPRAAASRLHWRLTERDPIVLGLNGSSDAPDSQVSREHRMHLEIYRELSGMKGVLHLHPDHALVFAHANKPVPARGEVLTGREIERIPLCEPAESGTQELAEGVAEALAGQSGEGRACLMPGHGAVVAARDSDLLVTLMQAVEQSARIELFSRLV